MLWHLHGQHLDITLLCRPSRLPLPLHPSQADLVAFYRLHTQVPAAFDEMTAVTGSGDIVGSLGAAGGPLALLSAMWVLMMTPTTASSTQIDGQTGRTTSGSTPMRGQVTVIDLRPMRTVHTDQDEGSGRALTRRHIVRGHWTHQPHGPARSLRRLQWVDSYIRGPAGAPLDERTIVYQWRR